MPRAFDRRQLTITHDPTRRITEELPRTPPFTGPTMAFPPGASQPKPAAEPAIDDTTERPAE